MGNEGHNEEDAEFTRVYDSTLHKLAQKNAYAERKFSLYDEKDGSSYRSLYARDRDRIVYCNSFRKLMHKTQLYISYKGNEQQRTRLTHTIEVVTIARAIARQLGMNEELVEAIAYGHDIGHSPFGHAGETQLDRILMGNEPLPGRIVEVLGNRNKMYDSANFKHNYQSVRVLSFLECYHISYCKHGLNLTLQTLEGILKHTKIYLKDKKDKYLYPGLMNGIFNDLHIDKEHSVSVEGQIVNISDEIAQVTHDIHDGLEVGVLKYEDIMAKPELSVILQNDKVRDPVSIPATHKKTRNSQVYSSLLNHFISIVVIQFRNGLKRFDPIIEDNKLVLNDYILPDNKIISDAFHTLKKLKDDYVMNTYAVNRMDKKGEYIIRKLFNAYLNSIRQLPDSVFEHYAHIKKLELDRDPEHFVRWIKSTGTNRRLPENIVDTMNNRLMGEVIGLLKDISLNIGGKINFRLIPKGDMDILFPYLFYDGDFIRAIIDYIAGMTDDFAEEEYRNLYVG
ncbi:MAG: dNTP triphosphohydrolase [Nitrospirae bacterium]|nr:dNTP triphosphohydrolase [Nitrospirota bacterium]